MVFLLAPQLDIANVVSQTSSGTGEVQQQSSPVKSDVAASVIIPGTSGAAGGGDEVIPLNRDNLTPTQQAVVTTMEEAGVVSVRGHVYIVCTALTLSSVYCPCRRRCLQ